MLRQVSSQVVRTITYTGQGQDTINLPAGRFINELRFQLDCQYDVTTSTANAHPAGLANLIDRLEVVTANGKTITDLSGQDISDLFRFINAVPGDNTALHAGGANANDNTARVTLRLPFYLNDGQREDDGILQTNTQDVIVRITWKTPTSTGSLYGTATGLVIDSLTCKVSFKEYRVDAEMAAKLMKGVERSLRKADYAVTQTNDAFQLDNLPKNERYRGLTLISRSTTNNMTPGNSAGIDHTKEMAVRSTLDNNIWQRDTVRVFRSETIQRRGHTDVTAGVVDVPTSMFGSMVETIVSTNNDELFLEVPAVNTGTAPFIRVITDTIRPVA